MSSWDTLYKFRGLTDPMVICLCDLGDVLEGLDLEPDPDLWRESAVP